MKIHLSIEEGFEHSNHVEVQFKSGSRIHINWKVGKSVRFGPETKKMCKIAKTRYGRLLKIDRDKAFYIRVETWWVKNGYRMTIRNRTEA